MVDFVHSMNFHEKCVKIPNFTQNALLNSENVPGLYFESFRTRFDALEVTESALENTVKMAKITLFLGSK